MTGLLVARGVTVRRGGRALVDSLDLEVEPGRVTVIVGPNGAGKSTLLRLLAGETAPARGEVRLWGRRLGDYAPWDLACRRAVMLQHETVAFPFTAFEVARLGLEGVGRGLSGPDRDRIARRAMHAADVAHLAGRPIASLSGGEAQRVRFARALAQIEAGRTACGADRQLVFLDEPVASLDLAHQLRLVDEAARLARSGRAVVAILHDLQLAAHCADRILVMNAGRRVAEGAPRDVLTPAIIAAAFGVALVRPSLPDLPWRPLGRAGAAPSAAHGP